MTSFNVHEAKTHFSKLLERVESGEVIEIRRNGEPVARLVGADVDHERRRSAFGVWKGRIEMPEELDERAQAELEAAFYDGPLFPPGYDQRTGEKLG